MKLKTFNSGGNKSGKINPDYRKDKFSGYDDDFPLLEIVLVIVLVTAWYLLK